ncbi:hypothetical protein XELAEV_18008193mg [Xenopus laevis]|uniref:Uncharacterized protein n=1 Tax=Xenopus laevis TaxID=8355 RepID=A0A974E2U1_XENLA|nr:hypothetical protein XELAEV_18008193mg [Xenopus laevis]
MAAVDLREELTCSICLSLYTDPVTLPCGHNFCQGCIERLLCTQEGFGGYSCPACRKKFQKSHAMQRNTTLNNIAERFRPTETEPGETDIFCTYCVHSLVPAVKSCLHCEASLCDTHLRVHSISAEHVLTRPTTSFMDVTKEHRDHNVETLNEASEKKKENLRNFLEKLSLERGETERGVQRLQKRRREVEEKAARATERRRDISRQKDELSHQLWDLVQQLEIKKEEMSRKIHQIEELCNMADPLTVLQNQESDGAAFCEAEGGNRKRRKIEDINDPAVGDLDVDQISETLLTGFAGIVTGLKGRVICCQEAKDLLLDKKTAWNDISISGDGKCATSSCTYTDFPIPQALSIRSFSSERHYWEVEGSESGVWRVGVAYPSIERENIQSWIGENNKSWCLYRHSKYEVIHDKKRTVLPHVLSCTKIRISLDYKAGRLSFYELSEPIRHLHTFTATNHFVTFIRHFKTNCLLVAISKYKFAV